MIISKFPDYCENCKELEPEAEKDIVENITGENSVFTTIMCKHRDRCAAILQYLKGADY